MRGQSCQNPKPLPLFSPKQEYKHKAKFGAKLPKQGLLHPAPCSKTTKPSPSLNPTSHGLNYTLAIPSTPIHSKTLTKSRDVINHLGLQDDSMAGINSRKHKEVFFKGFYSQRKHKTEEAQVKT
ncbi:hypothetical protein Tco_0408077 [Tanacetum coccineum]